MAAFHAADSGSIPDMGRGIIRKVIAMRIHEVIAMRIHEVIAMRIHEVILSMI